MGLKVLLVNALNNVEAFVVEIDQLDAVFFGEFVVAIVGEAIHGRTVGRRLGDDDVLLADGMQEFDDAFEVVDVGGAQRNVDDDVIGLEDDPLVADGSRDFFLEGFQRFECNVGAIVSGGERDAACEVAGGRRRGLCGPGRGEMQGSSGGSAANY